MTHQADNQNNPARQPSGRPYHSPRLLAYGAIRELTLGGVGSTQEMMAMTNLMRFP